MIQNTYHELKHIQEDMIFGAGVGFISTSMTIGGIIALGGTVPGAAAIGFFKGLTGIKINIPENATVKVVTVTSAIIIGGALAATEGGLTSAALTFSKVIAGSVIYGTVIGSVGNGMLGFIDRRLDFFPNGIEI